MKRLKKRFLLLLTTVTLVAPFIQPEVTLYAQDDATTNETAKETTSEENLLDVKAAIAIDEKTGKIFYEQNATETLGIASMTKLLSVYLVLDAIQSGTIKWDDPVNIADYLYPLSQNMELSNVPLYAGNTYTVKELYEASLIVSANAAIIALANHISGDEEKFVELMKKKLSDLKIEDATIVNSSGLTNIYLGDNRVPGTELDAENYMSAKDMAILTRQLLLDHPEILETTKQTTKTFGVNTSQPLEMKTWNWMLPGESNEKAGVDGLKTGTTDIAGACFVGTKEKDGQRVITVVMHANQHDKDPQARFIETGKLMDYVDNTWEQVTITPDSTSLKTTQLPVTRGTVKDVSLVLASSEPVTLWTKKGQVPVVKEIISENSLEQGKLMAPIHKGVKVGSLAISTEDSLGFVNSDTVNSTEISIETNEEIERGSFLQQMKEILLELKDKIIHFFQK